MKVLFICKSNIGRSQMGEAFIKYMYPLVKAISAGVAVGIECEGKQISTVTHKVIDCMAEVGIDMSNYKMSQLTKDMVDEVDVVISITPESILPDYLSSSDKLIEWDIPDAGGTDMEFHRKVRDMIKEHIKSFVNNLN